MISAKLVRAAALAATTALCSTAGGVSFATEVAPASDRVTIRVNAQAQQGDYWCWAVTGLITSQALGHAQRANQNDFCKTVRGINDPHATCPDEIAQMGDVIRGMRAYGVSGGHLMGVPSFATLKQNINAGAPVPAGYYWTAGGGHMIGVIGYDDANQSVMIHDSLVGNRRMMWLTYDEFVSNNQWRMQQAIVGQRSGGGWANPRQDRQDTTGDAQATSAAKPQQAEAVVLPETALRDAQNQVSAFFAEQQRATGEVTQRQHSDPKLTAQGITVNTLNPDFVRGVSDTPYLAQAVASLATTAGGDQAVVLFDTSGSQPRFAQALSGDDEVRYANLAAGGVVFKEPQINGYFRLFDGQITGLNEAAQEVVGAGVSVARYQELVAAKYAHKMAGSHYQTNGYFG